MATQEQQEKKRLTQEELNKLENQYFSLSQTLRQYEDGMKSQAYKKWPVKQQEQTKKQYEFMKFSINETIRVLILHDFLREDISDDASRNKFVKLTTKFEIMKYNRRKKYQK